MAIFLATTSRGLHPVLEKELHNLGITKTKKTPAGVEFETSWQNCYVANRWLRSATRILLPVLDFPVYQPDDLYNNMRRHDFTKYINPEQTLIIEAKVSDSTVYRDQRFLAQKTKDAIVDQFTKKFSVRPSVDKDHADLRVHVRLKGTQASVAVDTSGESLTYRNYREHSVIAPLREHLAAGLVALTEWQGDLPIVDPMCGSGTILIEAALMAKGVPPSYKRKQFGFMHLKNYSAEAWQKVPQEKAATAPLPHFYGYDRDPQAIRAAKANAKLAGVADLVHFSVGSLDQLTAPVEKGIIITNPPYGERLGKNEELVQLFSQMGQVFKKEFPNWSCWILSGNDELTKHLRMKSAVKHRVFNGNLDCRFMRYDVLAPKGSIRGNNGSPLES